MILTMVLTLLMQPLSFYLHVDNSLAQSGPDKAATLTENTEVAKSAARCGSFFGLCWYWWVGIALVVVTLSYILLRAGAGESGSDEDLPAKR